MLKIINLHRTNSVMIVKHISHNENYSHQPKAERSQPRSFVIQIKNHLAIVGKLCAWSVSRAKRTKLYSQDFLTIYLLTGCSFPLKAVSANKETETTY